MISTTNELTFTGTTQAQIWHGPEASIALDASSIRAALLNLNVPCYVVRRAGVIGVTNQGQIESSNVSHNQWEVLAAAFPLPPEGLGDVSFKQFYGLKYAYMAGAMANGISSEAMVIALSKHQFMGVFGAAGIVPERLEAVIHRIKEALSEGRYAFNLIHSPYEEALERRVVDLYLAHGITTVEASAFLDLTSHVVRYRAAGLGLDPQGQIVIGNKVIIKLSRREVAAKFMQPPPPALLQMLLEQGAISELQATLASQVTVADDVTVEADSGGHTDNRPLVSLLPSIMALRDELRAPVRVGAAGGIGTPEAALSAFMMGAAYVVTGSINQACVEAGTSEHTRRLLAGADMADVMMAPSADMFEMGVKVQVLKRGTMFPMRAQKLYELYKTYDSIEAIPVDEREKLEKQIFKRPLEAIWQDTVAFFNQRDPEQIKRAQDNPKRKMALVFRWYLGLSSRWSNSGEKGRETDYQIWCGPSIGAFNAWTRGTYLEAIENRHVVDVAWQIMAGAAFLYRVQSLKLQGVQFPLEYNQYWPQQH